MELNSGLPKWYIKGVFVLGEHEIIWAIRL